MCFDESYATKYSTLVKRKKQLLSLYWKVLKNPSYILILSLFLILYYLLLGTWSILVLLIFHTLTWALFAIPEYVKIKKELKI